MANEHLIPIDIKDVKLLEWLVDRNIVNRLWNEQCGELRDLLKEVENGCPISELSQKIKPPLHYNLAKEVLHELDQSPYGSKNLIGSYTHDYTAKWARIVKLFEREQTFLADSARIIIQNVKYDIPLLRKQIARSELENLVQDLPILMIKISNQLPTLTDTLNYYQEFARFLIDNPELEVCPMLLYVIKFGNVSVKQWQSGPLQNESDTDSSVEVIEPIGAADTDSNGCVVIETLKSDVDCSGDPVPCEYGADDGTDVIDFGTHIDFGDDIDFGIEAVDYEGGEIDFGDVEISVVEDGEEKGKESLLENTNTRNKIVDELYELLAFLTSRRDELLKHGQSIISEIANCPTIVLTTQVETIEVMLSTVNGVLASLTNDKMRHLLLLKNSEKYLERLTDAMQSQLRLCDKMEDNIEDLKIRIADAEQTFEEVEPKLQHMIEVTKELKKEVERELSKRYKGRPVRIMGDINTL